MRLLKILSAFLCSVSVAYAVDYDKTTTDETSMTKSNTYTHQGHAGYVGPFKNHLNSGVIVSPTQIYQIGHLRTDWQLGVNSSKADFGSQEFKQNVTDINGAVVYNFKPYNIRTGLRFNYGMGTSKEVGVSTDTDFTTWTVEPTAAMPVGEFVVGLAAAFTGIDTSESGSTDQDVTYSQFKPAVAYTGSNFEAGIVFATEVEEKATKATDLPAFVPATITAHGRYATTNEFAFGGVLENRGYKSFSSSAFKDQIGIKATAEYDPGLYKLEGTLGHNTKFYKGSANADVDNIATTELGFAGDYRMGNDATVGGTVTYGFGSDDAGSTKIKVSDLAFGVRTNFTF